MKKNIKKMFAILLSFVLITCSLPMQSLAVDKEQKATKAAVSADVDVDKLKVIGELEEKRDEFSKTYELEDGTFYEVHSSSPLHIKRLNKWVDAKKISQPRRVDEVTAIADKLTDAVAQKNGLQNSSVRTISDPDIEEDSHDSVDVLFAPSTVNGDENISNSCAMIVQDYDLPYGDETPLGYEDELTLSYTVTLELSEADDPTRVYAYPVDHDYYDDDDLLFANFNYQNQPNIDVVDIQEVELEGSYDFDASFVYNDWLIGARNNYGLAFISDSSDGIDLIGDVYQIRRYKEMSLINNDSTYHQLDMGLAGTLYIDDYTNLVSLARDEMGMPNNAMPVAIQRWISPISLGESSCYGENCYINYHSYITVADQTYTWYSVGGKAIRFTVTNTSQDVADADGLGYTINVSDKEITDSNGNVFQFNSALYLTYITDQYQNKTKLSYTTSNGVRRISYIEEVGNARRYSFTYSNVSFTYNGTPFTKRLLTDITVKQGTNNRYSTIQIDGEDVKVSYEYMALSDSLVVLRKATYPDGSIVTYNYDNNGRLTSATDADGRKVTINYSTDIKHYNLNNSNIILTSNMNRSDSVCVGYTEQKVNSNNTSTYINNSKMVIDNHTQLARLFDDKKGNLVSAKFNSYLKPENYVDENGDTYLFDYDSTPQTVTCIKKHTNKNSLIENGEFIEDNSHALEDTWFTESDCEIVNLYYTDEEGNQVLKFNADGTEDLSAFTVVDLSQSDIEIDGDSVFILDCDGFLNTANENSSHFAGIKVYPCEDDEGNDCGNEIFSLSFESGNSYKKQHKCGCFSLGNVETDYLKVEILYTKQFNDAYFDNISLLVDNGEIVETKNLNAIAPALAPQEYFQKDSHGLITEHALSNGTQFVTENYGYSATAPYDTTSSTDFNNAIVTYTYSDSSGLVGSKQSGNKKTKYMYNPLGLLSSVETVEQNVNNPLSIINAFDYDYNKISKVTHGNMVYSFDYNTDGEVVSVRYSENSGSSFNSLMNTYYNSNEHESVIHFVNGDELKYAYSNDDGTITGVYFKGYNEGNYQQLAAYTYDASVDKHLIRIQDYQTDRIYNFGSNGNVKMTQLNYTNGLPQVPSEQDENQLVESPYNTDPLPVLNVYSYSHPSRNVVSEKMYDWQITSTKNEDNITSGTRVLSSSSEYKLNEMQFSITDNNTVYSYHGENMSGSINMNTSTTKDVFGRTTSSEYVYTTTGNNTQNKVENTYEYKMPDRTTSFNALSGQTATSYLPSSYSTHVTPDSNASIDLSYEYDYNNLGFLTKVTLTNNNDSQIHNELPYLTPTVVNYYDYDNFGQIITMYDYSKKALFNIEYDSNGNITKKTIIAMDDATVDFTSGFSYSFPNNEYSFKTMDYEYNSKNQLIKITTKKFNHTSLGDVQDGSASEKTLSYDENGNTTHYVNGNYEHELEWDGYLLKKYVYNSDKWTNYFYDDENRLIEKVCIQKKFIELPSGGSEVRTLNESTTKYIWQDDHVEGMEYRVYDDDNNITSITTIKYIYDDEGNLIGALPHAKSRQEENLSSNPDPSESNGFNCIVPNKPIWFINDGIGNIVGMHQSGSNLGYVYTFNANGESGNDEFFGPFSDDLAAYFRAQGTPAWALPIAMILGLGAVSDLLSTYKVYGYKGYLFDEDSGFLLTNGRFYSPVLSRYVDGNPSYMTEKQYTQTPYITNLYSYASNNAANYDSNNQYIFDKVSVPYMDIKSTLWIRNYFN